MLRPLYASCDSLITQCPLETPGGCPGQAVKTVTPAGKTVYPVKAINVLKAHGKSARESALLNGYALNLGRASQGMPKFVKPARVACLDMNLQRARMHMGIQARWPSGLCS